MKNRLIRKKIKKLISNTELEITFSVLRLLYENQSQDIYKELIILQGQYQHLSNTKELRFEQEVKEINKIVEALTGFTKQLRKVYGKNIPDDIAEKLSPLLPQS